jgi:hypothetical protein
MEPRLVSVRCYDFITQYPALSAEILAAGGDESNTGEICLVAGVEYSWPCQIEGLEKSTTGSSASQN